MQQMPEIAITADGSYSLYNAQLNEHYHSKYGALQESLFIYIQTGLEHFMQKGMNEVSVLEMGFGTGLNCLLTYDYAIKRKIKIKYSAVDILPLKDDVYSQLNYADFLKNINAKVIFMDMHTCGWNVSTIIDEDFILTKLETDLKNFYPLSTFDLIYYDAFGPKAQPELWTLEIFEKLFNWLNPGGSLVTYCSKGDVRRNMMSAGFKIEKLPGPPGKREILRATK